MTTIPQVAAAMQAVLTMKADDAAHRTGFVQRESKMGGAAFAQTLVFGWLENPQATLEELSQTAATVGVVITPQGLDQRFSESAAQCLREVLEAAVREVVVCDPVAIPVLQRFGEVYLDDSSTVTLPAELAATWSGSGGTRDGTGAGLKLQVRLEYTRGTLHGPFLQDGRANDRTSVLQQLPVVAHSLRMADGGYWSLEELAARDRQGGYWLFRARVGTKLYTQDGQPWTLVELLRSIPDAEVDVAVELGVQHHVPARLLAVRVSQEVAEGRRRRMHQVSRDNGRPVSKAQLALADWTIFVTNVPSELLNLHEALTLARVRWQIELLFKLWKSHGRIDEWRTCKPWRILCEVYAKLIAMVVQHWLLLISCWFYADRSLTKAAKTIRKHATVLACNIASSAGLSHAIETIQRCLSAGCRINKRKTTPHTYQLLLSLADGA